ncbi:MFS transporter [Candidatus Pantoea formicae]|uniref:MFS transporter n=1 Tax=Candidatus Pantoea formicae TaxID=2608355 RepID=UPI003EDAC538
MSYRVRVATVYLLGFFIDLVNMFIANVAYPEIGRHFQAPVSQLAWVSNAYILGLTLVIPLSGWLAQRIGAKRLFILSLMIFMLGSVGVAASLSILQLIGWRFLQGVGGGLLIPIGQTLTYALYRSHERAKLSSVVMLVALLAPALSPAAGGLLIESLNWRWVFLASLPLAVVTLLLAGFWLNADKSTEAAGRLDLVGLVSGCAALTLILLGLTSLGESQSVHQGVLMLISGIIVFSGYVWNALGKNQPLINLHLIKDPLFKTAMLIYQFVPGVFTGVSMITMLYLQNELGMHAAFVGALMLPWSIASFIAISFTGRRFNSLGPRPLFILGCVVQALGIGLLATTGHSASAMICVIAFCLMGFGGSLCSSTAQSSAFLYIPDGQLADASAIWNINRQLSFCLGVTLISLLFNLLANSGISDDRAYQLCFVIAACSSVVPILCCLHIANRNVLFTLNQEKP